MPIMHHVTVPWLVKVLNIKRLKIRLLTLFLRCIKDWISTKQVAYYISGKENDMGCGVISNHQVTPFAHPKPTHNASIPTKHTYRVADLQEQRFSLFFLDSSKCQYPQQISQRRMSNYAYISQKQRNTFPKVNMYANDVFPLGVTELPILRPTVHNSRCCTLLISVVLIYMSTNQQHPLKKL